MFVTALLLTATAGFAADVQTVTPIEDPDVAPHNPDMGWVLYENYPLDPRPNGTGTMNILTNETFAECDVVAVMFAWSDVEKAEGGFDWSRVDAAWDHWQRLGKSIHMRISTEPLFGWSHVKPAGGLGIPDWLLARIPDEQKKRRTDGAMYGWHVDARNALYQERLRIFLRKANAHFSGPRAPTLVDLRGFGRWGEWHTGYPYASLDDRRAALRDVLEIWSASFPDRMLALSYSHDPDGPKELYAGASNRLDPAFTANYDDFLRYSAFDLALQHGNITFRRDGAGGAVFPNQRKLCEHLYRDLRRAPLASEFVSGYAQAKKGDAGRIKWLISDALSLHPNYIGLLGYSGRDALAFMQERPDLVARGLRGMGYRLVPVQVSYPSVLQAGEPCRLDMTWVNRAAGRALRDYHVLVRLVNDQGATMALADAGTAPTSRWLQGETNACSVSVTFGRFDSAETRARMQVGLRDAGSGRMIGLPVAHRTADGFADLGTAGLRR